MSNKQKTPLLPKLRFPEFRSAGDWTTEKLGSVASISTEKVGSAACVPMSITSGVGLVSQEDKFGRVIAGDSYKNYLLLKPNDFAYNKSATKEYPEGFLALHSGSKLAAVPNSIFTCFRVNGKSPIPTYLNYLFLGNLHGLWLRKFIQVGARAHGSLSINDSDLMALPVPLPTGDSSVAEQQKISDCLSSLDELIAAQARKVAALKTHKKGLMQQLFPREGETRPYLRFPESRNGGEWKKMTLGQAATFYNGRAYKQEELLESGKYPVLRVGNFFTSNTWYHSDLELDDTKYCENGDLLYAWSASFGPRVWRGKKSIYHYHIWKVVEQHGIDKQFLFVTLENETERMKAKSTNGLGIMHITKGAIESWETTFPALAEQRKIAHWLINLDNTISEETRKLEVLARHKNGLLQRLVPFLDETPT